MPEIVVRKDTPNELTEPDGVDSPLGSVSPRRVLPAYGSLHDVALEQQIIDMISEGCPNTQGL